MDRRIIPKLRERNLAHRIVARNGRNGQFEVLGSEF